MLRLENQKLMEGRGRREGGMEGGREGCCPLTTGRQRERARREDQARGPGCARSHYSAQEHLCCGRFSCTPDRYLHEFHQAARSEDDRAAQSRGAGAANSGCRARRACSPGGAWRSVAAVGRRALAGHGKADHAGVQGSEAVSGRTAPGP